MIMLKLTKLITLVLGVVDGFISYMRDKTLIDKGRLEKENTSLKETIRRTILYREISSRPTPDNDLDILRRM